MKKIREECKICGKKLNNLEIGYNKCLHCQQAGPTSRVRTAGWILFITFILLGIIFFFKTPDILFAGFAILLKMWGAGFEILIVSNLIYHLFKKLDLIIDCLNEKD